jgi:hypothetical protein
MLLRTYVWIGFFRITARLSRPRSSGAARAPSPVSIRHCHAASIARPQSCFLPFIPISASEAVHSGFILTLPTDLRTRKPSAPQHPTLRTPSAQRIERRRALAGELLARPMAHQPEFLVWIWPRECFRFTQSDATRRASHRDALRVFGATWGVSQSSRLDGLRRGGGRSGAIGTPRSGAQNTPYRRRGNSGRR